LIRLATPADEAAIRACAEAAYGRYVAAIGRRPAPMDADYAGHIAAGEAHVADDDAGHFLGFIVFFPEDGAMQLENVAVLPEAAGRGIGKTLVAFCEDEARRLGLHAVRLYTNEKMAENTAIYPHLGYRETERRSEHGFNRVFFEKVIL
jgi:ribosomal protein S18 acetylase RimI-like enzyme